MNGPPTPCLVGATGTGKSEVAKWIARARSGEVIACDAFSVYRGMEVLSAAPRADGVPHHLVGFLDPGETWSAARFAAECDRLVGEARARGHEPWVVGGTALYLRSWLKGFGAPVPRDAALRARLSRIAREEGPEALHLRLAERDPARARQVHPRDERRLVRALEILEATGQPPSRQRREWAGPDRVPAVVVGLRREGADLDRRIRARVDEMFGAGVVEEARRLLAGPLSPEAGKVLGLAEIEALLRGRSTEEEAREAIARRTRRFAKRQGTFFRSFAGVRWVDLAPDESVESAAGRVLEALGLA
jgi:tRNA dimethylallyltransferase